MGEIVFGIALDAELADRESATSDLESMDATGLRTLAEGVISIRFPKQNIAFAIASEVIDYLDQMLGVIQVLDSGDTESFTVSGDYYSNNYNYTLVDMRKLLQIMHVNSGVGPGTVRYVEYRTGFIKFYNSAMQRIEALYPRLGDNRDFQCLRAAANQVGGLPM